MIRSLTALFALVVISACANSSLLVEQRNTSAFITDSATIEYDGSNVEVNSREISYTQRKMENAFFGGAEPLFLEGEGITVKYRYLAFDEGNRAARYLVGPITGGAKIVLEVDFASPEGELLAQVRGEGEVRGGFFGGSNRTGIQKAIDDVAVFAAREFRQNGYREPKIQVPSNPFSPRVGP